MLHFHFHNIGEVILTSPLLFPYVILISHRSKLRFVSYFRSTQDKDRFFLISLLFHNFLSFTYISFSIFIMGKSYRRKFYKSASKDKYSIETKAGYVSTPASATAGLYQNTANIVPFTSVEGMRKVNYIALWLVVQVSTTALSQGYVEGYAPNPTLLWQSSTELWHYGITLVLRTTGLCNLNSGDAIWLVVGTASANQTLGFHVKYAVSLQWDSILIWGCPQYF